jgi:amino acid transporter
LTLWLAWYFSEGNSAKYFGAILGIAVSTTLISYLAVFPALWRLRVKFPNHPRPFKAPAPAFLSIWLTILIVFATIQLLMPGLGSDWFGDAFRPEEWTADENWRYFLFQGIPLLVFIIIGSIFYVAGGKTRGDRGQVALEEAEREGLDAS